MNTEHTEIEDELPVLDVSWCARDPSPEGPWCQRLWPPGPNRFITLMAEGYKQELKLADALRVHVWQNKLIQEAQEIVKEAAQQNTEPLYVFGKVVPVGRTPENELIAIAFQLVPFGYTYGVNYANETDYWQQDPIDIHWIGFVYASEHYAAIEQIVAGQIEEYRDLFRKQSSA